MPGPVHRASEQATIHPSIPFRLPVNIIINSHSPWPVLKDNCSPQQGLFIDLNCHSTLTPFIHSVSGKALQLLNIESLDIWVCIRIELTGNHHQSPHADHPLMDGTHKCTQLNGNNSIAIQSIWSNRGHDNTRTTILVHSRSLSPPNHNSICTTSQVHATAI